MKPYHNFVSSSGKLYSCGAIGFSESEPGAPKKSSAVASFVEAPRAIQRVGRSILVFSSNKQGQVA